MLTDQERTTAATLAAEYLIFEIGYSPRDASDALTNARGVSRSTLDAKYGKAHRAAAAVATKTKSDQPPPSPHTTTPVSGPETKSDQPPPSRHSSRSSLYPQGAQDALFEQAVHLVLAHGCSTTSVSNVFNVGSNALAQRVKRKKKDKRNYNDCNDATHAHVIQDLDAIHKKCRPAHD